MPRHILEETYGLTWRELLDGVAKRFRLRTALEGAVAEIQMERHLMALVGKGIDRYESHDLNGHPDFSIRLPGRENPILAECKNVRNHDEAYRKGGEIVAYKVETQKTRASQGDASSRFYDATQFAILGVCLGKKTGDWRDMIFIQTKDLDRHLSYSGKLAVFQRVPLPDAEALLPWHRDLGELLRTMG
jgi:hypothetical protein